MVLNTVEASIIKIKSHFATETCNVIRNTSNSYTVVRGLKRITVAHELIINILGFVILCELGLKLFHV